MSARNKEKKRVVPIEADFLLVFLSISQSRPPRGTTCHHLQRGPRIRSRYRQARGSTPRQRRGEGSWRRTSRQLNRRSRFRRRPLSALSLFSLPLSLFVPFLRWFGLWVSFWILFSVPASLPTSLLYYLTPPIKTSPPFPRSGDPLSFLGLPSWVFLIAFPSLAFLRSFCISLPSMPFVF